MLPARPRGPNHAADTDHARGRGGRNAQCRTLHEPSGRPLAARTRAASIRTPAGTYTHAWCRQWRGGRTGESTRRRATLREFVPAARSPGQKDALGAHLPFPRPRKRKMRPPHPFFLEISKRNAYSREEARDRERQRVSTGCLHPCLSHVPVSSSEHLTMHVMHTCTISYMYAPPAQRCVGPSSFT